MSTVDSPARAGGEWALAGRAGELRILDGQLRRADARGIVLAGGAGVGKTRLGQEFLRRAGEAGRRVARATASRAASGLPFGAVAPLLPEGGYESAMVGDRAEMLRRFAAALAAPAADGRLVLLVDDAHLLDDASATLIHHLAVAGSAFLIVTVRTREPAPEPVTALWKDGILERLDLGELDGEVIETLLRDALGGPVDRAVVVRLAARCRGNVLFLREMVLGALAAGTLICDDGLWRLAGSLAPSPRLVELIQSRLAGLEPADRALVEVVAVAGCLGPAELDAQADLSVAESLERKGILVSTLSGRRLEFRLAHPLHGEVLRSGASALRTRAVARALVRATEAAGARRAGDRLQLATWLLEAGDARPDVMLAAARTARDRYDFVLAERLARAAADGGAGLEAAVLAARLASLSGRGDEAEAVLAQLAAVVSGDADSGLVAVTRLDNLRLIGRFHEAMAVADAATEAIADAGWRTEIDARRCGLLLDVEGPVAAAQASAAVRERVQGSSLVPTCLVAAYAHGRMGSLAAAEEACAQAEGAARRLPGARPWSALATLARAEARRLAGAFTEAESACSEIYEQAVQGGSLDAQAYSAWQLARIMLSRGRVASAEGYAREAAVLLRQLNRRPHLRDCQVVLATATALRGSGREPAAATLGDLDALGIPSSQWVGADSGIARAWVAVAAKDIPRARRLLEDAATLGRRVGDRVGEANALYDLARLGHSKEVATRLAEVAASVEGDLAPLQVAHAAAASQGDAPALERVSRSLEVLGALLLAAEAAADAAVAWRRGLEPRAAAAAERMALALAERCEGATTPALGAVDGRALLTAAERETALLAASGRSNKEIAQQLVLSLRTVENYLHRVYAKLDIAGRSELAAALEG